MDREIKFRAWHKKLNEMFRVKEIYFMASVGGLDKEENSYTFPIEDIELMQFTGLLDKSGKEIYEGDIIKYSLHETTSLARIVKFGEWPDCDISSYWGWGFLYTSFNEYWKTLDVYNDEIINEHEYIVIGNIYEVPQLIKEHNLERAVQAKSYKDFKEKQGE